MSIRYAVVLRGACRRRDDARLIVCQRLARPNQPLSFSPCSILGYANGYVHSELDPSPVPLRDSRSNVRRVAPQSSHVVTSSKQILGRYIVLHGCTWWPRKPCWVGSRSQICSAREHAPAQRNYLPSERLAGLVDPFAGRASRPPLPPTKMHTPGRSSNRVEAPLDRYQNMPLWLRSMWGYFGPCIMAADVRNYGAVCYAKGHSDYIWNSTKAPLVMVEKGVHWMP